MMSDFRPADIILTICPAWGVDMPSLGITYLASYLQLKGFTTELLDMNICFYQEVSNKERKLWQMGNYYRWADENLFIKIKRRFNKKINYYVDYILSKRTKVIGFSLMGANTLFSIEMARRLKQVNPGLIIIFGGPDCFWQNPSCDLPLSMHSPKTGKPYFNSGLIDIFIFGEGEETLEYVLYMIKKGHRYPVKGAKVYLGSNYSIFSPRALIEDLDTIPFPFIDKLPLSSYTANKLPLLMSRGCIRRCNFCNDFIINNSRFRTRTAKNVFEEIEYKVKKFNIKNFEFNDLLINGDLGELDNLCKLLINSDLKINWSGQAIIRKDMILSLFKKLKRSGCAALTYGVESLSDFVLKIMNKPYTSEDALKVLSGSKKAGIITRANFIVGFPGERSDHLKETLENLKKGCSYIDCISSLNPCCFNSGTELEKCPERFSAVSSGGHRWYKWYTKDKENTYSLRINRLKEMLKFLETVHIPIDFVGVYGKVSLKKNKIMSILSLRLEDFFLKRKSKNKFAIKRPISKNIILIFLFFCLIILSFYLWFLKKFKKVTVLGGKD